GCIDQPGKQSCPPKYYGGILRHWGACHAIGARLARSDQLLRYYRWNRGAHALLRHMVFLCTLPKIPEPGIQILAPYPAGLPAAACAMDRRLFVSADEPGGAFQ